MTTRVRSIGEQSGLHCQLWDTPDSSTCKFSPRLGEKSSCPCRQMQAGSWLQRLREFCPPEDGVHENGVSMWPGGEYGQQAYYLPKTETRE